MTLEEVQALCPGDILVWSGEELWTLLVLDTLPHIPADDTTKFLSVLEYDSFIWDKEKHPEQPASLVVEELYPVSYEFWSVAKK